jgi:hypothetical protein
VDPLARVAVLVEVRAVEEAGAVLVGREVDGHPVEEDADAGVMQPLDEDHQVLRRTVAARRREVAGRLVAPRAVERMLHDGEELDVREPHLRRVGGSCSASSRYVRLRLPSSGTRRHDPTCTS